MASFIEWISGRGKRQALPPDRLRIAHLARGARACAGLAGLPPDADGVAYEPTQRLLAVAGAYGRVVIVARDNAERQLRAARTEDNDDENDSGAAHAYLRTRQLFFLAHRGALVRLDEDGALQLWPVEAAESSVATIATAGSSSSTRRHGSSQQQQQRHRGGGGGGGDAAVAAAEPPLSTLQLAAGDSVTCAAPLGREPYALLGCAGGDVCVAAAVNASGAPVAGARQARALALMPYTIPAKKLEARGAVMALAASSRPPVHRLLAVHAGSGGAAAWDLRAQRLIAVVPGGRGAVDGPVAAAAWLRGGRRGDFATGHASGDVLVWALPRGDAGVNGPHAAAAAGATRPSMSLVPQLLSRLRVAPPAAALVRPVASLQFLVAGRLPMLLVNGGGDADRPDGLSLLSVPLPTEGVGLDGRSPMGDGAGSSTSSFDSDEDGSQSGSSSGSSEGGSSGRLPRRGAANTPNRGARSNDAGSLRLKLPWRGVRAVCGAPLPSACKPYSEPSALIAAAEGGLVSVADLRNLRGKGATGGHGGSGKPGILATQQHQHQQQQPLLARALQPVKTPLQAQPAAITATRLCAVPQHSVPLYGLAGACMDGLRELADSTAAVDGSSGEGDGSGAGHWRGLLDVTAATTTAHSKKSQLAAAASADEAPTAPLYCVGHADGRVTLWELAAPATGAPRLLASAPSAPAARALAARGPTCSACCAVEFAWEQGVLVTGHEGGELRVYQINARPRCVNAICFESVGDARANASVRLDEPPGPQLLLQSLLHGADVAAVAYDPLTRRVAAADRSGAVSLTDLSQPAVLWLQAPLHAPAASVALARWPLPPAAAAARRRNGVGEEAACAVVVVAGVDASVAVLDAATGLPLSRKPPLRPKNACRALLVEPLHAAGAPVWMPRHVEDLAAYGLGRPAAAHASPQQAEAARRRAPGAAAVVAGGIGSSGSARSGRRPIGESREQQQQQRRGRYAAAEDEEQQLGDDPPEAAAAGEDEDGYEDDEGEDGNGAAQPQGSAREEDLDALLARAAAEVEARDRAGSSGGGAAEAGAAGGLRQRRGRPQQLDEGRRRRARRPQSSSPSPPPPRARQQQQQPGAKHDAPCAAFVLLATERYLRLYSAEAVAKGGRARTLRRVELPGALAFAATFGAGGGGGGGSVGGRAQAAMAPCLMCLVDSGGSGGGGGRRADRVQVYTLPGLELAAEWPLSASCGWPWKWACEPLTTASNAAGARRGGDGEAAAAAAAFTPALAACSRNGDVALLGEGRTLLRLALAAGAAASSAAPPMFDWDLATAAYAAAEARDRAAAAAAAAAAARNGRRGRRRGRQGRQERGNRSPSRGSEGRRQARGGAIAEAGAEDGGNGSSGGSATASGEEDDEQGAAAARGVAPAVAKAGKDIKRFVARVGADFQKAGAVAAAGLQKALDETGRGLARAAIEVRELPALIAAAAAAAGPAGGRGVGDAAAYPYPELAVIFAGAAPGRGAAAAGAVAASSVPAAGAVAATNGSPRVDIGAGAGSNSRRSDSGAALLARKPPPSPVSQRSSSQRAPPPAAVDDPLEDEDNGGGSSGSVSMRARAAGKPAAHAALSALPASSPSRASQQQPPLSPSPSPLSGVGGASSIRGGGGGARPRSAAEIRAAYGRPALPFEGRSNASIINSSGPASAAAAGGVAAGTAAAAAETRSRLADRGAALSKLADGSNELAEAAAGFASPAWDVTGGGGGGGGGGRSVRKV